MGIMFFLDIVVDHEGDQFDDTMTERKIDTLYLQPFKTNIFERSQN